MRKNIIYPTRTCFDDALDLLSVWAKERSPVLQDPTLAVVHGLVWQHGEPSAHGWIEIGDVCIFRGLKAKKRKPGHFATRWEEYYSELVIRETTRYTVAEALAENYKHQTYGPWVDRYLQFCRNGLIG